MKLKITYIDNDIPLNHNKIQVLEIENKRYFYRIVNDLYNLYQGDIADEVYFINDEGEEINCSGKIKIFLNYFDFNNDSKKTNNDIGKYVNNSMSEEVTEQLYSQYKKLINIYKKAINEIELPLKLEDEFSIEWLTKLVKIKLDYKKELLDNLFLLIELETVLKSNNLLIFINLKQYLTKEELEEFYKYAIYHQVMILLIDSQSYGTTLENEIKLIIDKNLEEFMIY